MPDVGSPCLIAFAFHFERHSVILKRTRECSLEYRHVLIEDRAESDGKGPEATFTDSLSSVKF